MHRKIEEPSNIVDQFSRLSISSEDDSTGLIKEEKENRKHDLDSSTDSDLDLFMGNSKKDKQANLDVFHLGNESINPFDVASKRPRINEEQLDQNIIDINANKRIDLQVNQQLHRSNKSNQIDQLDQLNKLNESNESDQCNKSYQDESNRLSELNQLDESNQQTDKQFYQKLNEQLARQLEQRLDQQSDSEDDDGKELEIQFETLPSNKTYLDSDPFYNDSEFDNEQQLPITEDDSMSKFSRKPILENIPEEDADKDDSQSGEFECVSRETVKDEMVDKVQDNESVKDVTVDKVQDNESVKDATVDKVQDNESEKHEDNKVIKQEEKSTESIVEEKSNENIDKESDIDKDLKKEEESGNEIVINKLEENSSDNKEDKIAIWRVENEEKIRLKDENEMESIDELKINAKKELDEWYAKYKADLKVNKNKNRAFEEELVKVSKAKAESRSWATVVEFCDFGFKGRQKDISRLKSVLIQLKASSVPSIE